MQHYHQRHGLLPDHQSPFHKQKTHQREHGTSRLRCFAITSPTSWKLIRDVRPLARSNNVSISSVLAAIFVKSPARSRQRRQVAGGLCYRHRERDCLRPPEIVGLLSVDARERIHDQRVIHGTAPLYKNPQGFLSPVEVDTACRTSRRQSNSLPTDSRADRNVGANKTSRISAAIPVLVMVPNNWNDGVREVDRQKEYQPRHLRVVSSSRIQPELGVRACREYIIRNGPLPCYATAPLPRRPELGMYLSRRLLSQVLQRKSALVEYVHALSGPLRRWPSLEFQSWTCRGRLIA